MFHPCQDFFSQRFNLVVLFGRGFNRYALKREYVKWETKTIRLGQLQTLSEDVNFWYTWTGLVNG